MDVVQMYTVNLVHSVHDNDNDIQLVTLLCDVVV